MSEQEEDLEDDEQEEPPGDEENAPSQNTPDTKAHWEHLALRELTEEERRLVVASARRVWRRWSGALRACSPEDLEVEGTLVVLQERTTASALPAGEGKRFLGAGIRRRLQKFVAQELHDRGKLPSLKEVRIGDDRAREVADEAVADWEGQVRDTLLEEISDERILAALRSLSPLDRRILDLTYIHRLTDGQIAARLNAEVQHVAEWPELTAEAVRNRRKRARSKLRALLQAEGDE